MSSNQIALIVDSCCDVPEEQIQAYGMYVIPVQVNYKNESYLDKVTISPREVYDRLEEEVPHTSTPTPAMVSEVLEQVMADGYTQAVVVTISSGLSSTYDLMRSVASGIAQLKTVIVDSKNIGLGAGLVALAIADRVEQGATLDDIEQIYPEIVAHTKVYFCVDTLEYLKKGGRIGKVAYAAGSLLNIRPVISCNEDGVYYTVAKAKGRKASLKRAMRCALDFAARFESCVMGVADGDAVEEARMVRAALGEQITHARAWYTGSVSPALVVHTGPGLVGVGVQGVGAPLRV